MLQNKTNEVDLASQFELHKNQVDMIHKELKDFKTLINDALTNETKLVSDTMDAKIIDVKKKVDIFDDVEAIRKNYQFESDVLADKFKQLNITTNERLETQDDKIAAFTVGTDADIKKLNNGHLSVLDRVDTLTDNYDKLNVNMSVIESYMRTFKKEVDALRKDYDKLNTNVGVVENNIKVIKKKLKITP